MLESDARVERVIKRISDSVKGPGKIKITRRHI